MLGELSLATTERERSGYVRFDPEPQHSADDLAHGLALLGVALFNVFPNACADYPLDPLTQLPSARR